MLIYKINKYIKKINKYDDGSGTLISCPQTFFVYVCESCYYFKICNQLGTEDCPKYASDGFKTELIKVKS